MADRIITKEERAEWRRMLSSGLPVRSRTSEMLRLLDALDEAEELRDILADMLSWCSARLCEVCNGAHCNSIPRFRCGFFDAGSPQDYIDVAMRELAAVKDKFQGKLLKTGEES
jgi:hypothetical protein